jgi:MtrB/PioB family decaheme-associated outer membrane protein
MAMRITKPASLVLALALLTAGAAHAQQNTPPPEPGQNTGATTLQGLGQVDFGFRATSYSDGSDEARYQRYRDLRNGAFIENFRWGANDDHALWDVRATHVGYRDQQYAANYNKFGKLKASFEVNQIPLFMSDVTRTAYTTTSPGVVSLGGLPAQVQSGAATSAIYDASATAFDLQLKRTITDFRIAYSLSEHLDLTAAFKNTNKSGEQPWAGTFGFSDAVELAVPVDTRTTDLGVAAEWTGERGQARVGYDGSFFSNNISTFVWSNPLRSTDSPTAGPAQGRMDLWPNSNLNSGSVSGLFKLPHGSQVSGYLSLGELSQNDALIPFTINTQLASPPLARPTADASAQIVATAFSYTARPASKVWMSAKFRSYDFDNKTPVFAVTNTVSYDTKVAPYDHGGTTPFSFNHKLFDLDGSWTPMPFTAFRAGYSYEGVSQTFRTFDTTNDNKFRLSADTTGLQIVTLRAQYEYSHRTGTGLDEQSLDSLGEQTSLRQFDLSNRNQHKFSAIAIANPTSSLSVNGSVFTVRDTRPDSGFGLLHNDSDGVSFGVDYVPDAHVSVGASYQYETYTTLQKSRQADPGPQFDDPTRDWTTTGGDNAHTFTASADLLKLWPKTDLRFSYDYVHATSSYVYALTANTTITPPVEQLPSLFNTRNRFTGDLRYQISPRIGAGLEYWYEKFTVDDFAFNPATLNTVAQPSFISLQSTYAPYTANTFWAKVTVFW